MKHASPSDRSTQPTPPSDAVLVAYLLGDSTPEDRLWVESWLAAEVDHGDRLVDLAATALAVDQIADRLARVPQTASHAVVRIEPPISRLRWRAVFALAATVMLVVFSLSRFTQSRFEQEIAVAWLEATPPGDAVVPEVVDYLDDRSAALEPLTAVSTNGDDIVSTELEPFGFATTEPPDWMLAAVSEMSHDEAFQEESAL